MIWVIHYFITRLKTKINVIPRGCFNLLRAIHSYVSYINISIARVSDVLHVLYVTLCRLEYHMFQICTLLVLDYMSPILSFRWIEYHIFLLGPHSITCLWVLDNHMSHTTCTMFINLLIARYIGHMVDTEGYYMTYSNPRLKNEP